jgi:3-phenylpropionate/trans-cinnamate dioxygenase ferredoxin reductase subunit
MSAPDTVVIVGGGLAGPNAAFALREKGFQNRVVLVSEEAETPYERPPLSKDYLRGEKTLEKTLVRPSGDYETEGVELLRSSRAVTLDPATRQLNLADGTNLQYDALLIATGAASRRLDAAGARLEGVHYLRDVADADALRAAAADARRIAVIGGGWVGSEVAASLRQLGRDVTLISNQPRPLERVLGPEVADVYREVHLEHGVRLVHGHVAALEGDERVGAVRLSDGTRIAADLVVVGIGAAPRIKLATRAGLETRDGAIVTDEFLRTSVPNIYAAGTWHRPGILDTGGTFASSTGTTRSARAKPPRPTSWAPGSRTSGRRTSIPISSSSAWNIAALRRSGARWSSAATCRPASSWRSGSPTPASSPP